MGKRIHKDRATHLPHFCRASGDVLSRIGDKWTVSVIGQLHRANRRMRFSELYHDIDGISERMLTMTLRTLERDGFIARIVDTTVPSKVNYELTPLGQSMVAPMKVVGQWANANIEAIEESRRQFDSAEEESVQRKAG